MSKLMEKIKLVEALSKEFTDSYIQKEGGDAYSLQKIREYVEAVDGLHTLTESGLSNEINIQPAVLGARTSLGRLVNYSCPAESKIILPRLVQGLRDLSEI